MRIFFPEVEEDRTGGNKISGGEETGINMSSFSLRLLSPPKSHGPRK
jgi:hypothetical protein